jgi:hypothetical protein
MEKLLEANKTFESEKDRELANAPKDIPGWGRNGADYERLNYEKHPQQAVTVEIFHSIERPGVTRVFGTSTPPIGLSGMIRRYAYKHSESTYAHWVPLVLADRIDVIQGIINDLKQGIVPNIFAEKGWQAEWKYNRQGLIKKVATTMLVTTAIILWLSRKRKKLA